MKIETNFDKKIKSIYGIIALPCPPKTLSSDYVEYGDIEIEEIILDIKPFAPKIQSYNINKDSLVNHKASKQLSKFLEDCERRRRENEDKAPDARDENYLRYKENVVEFINSISSKAKAEKAEYDSAAASKLKEQKVSVLGDLVRFSNKLEVDKEERCEQQRRIEECHDIGKQKEAIHIINQMVPVHEQLASAFARASSSSDVLRRMSSTEFGSIYSSEADISREKMVHMNAQMKTMFNSAKKLGKQDAPSTVHDVVHGAGVIGRTLKRANKTFQDNLHLMTESKRKKSEVQTELLFSLVKRDVKQASKVKNNDKKGHNQMDLILDSVVHKVKGKEVEKQVELDQKSKHFKMARQDTLDKIVDYGKRKSVLENMDTSYTKMQHDEQSEVAHARMMKTIGKNDSKVVGKPAKKVTLNSLIKKLPQSSTAIRKKSSIHKPSNPVVTKPSTLRPTGIPQLKEVGRSNTLPHEGEASTSSPPAIGRSNTVKGRASPGAIRTVSPQTAAATRARKSPGTSPRSTKKPSEPAGRPWK